MPAVLVVSGLMFVCSAWLFLLGRWQGAKSQLAYALSVLTLFLILVLSFMDDLGGSDLALILYNLILLVVLISNKKYYFNSPI